MDIQKDLENWIDIYRNELKELRIDSRISYQAGFQDHPFSIEPWEAEILFLSVLHFKPKISVELGAAFGFSALHIGKALKILNREGKIFIFEANMEILPKLTENIKLAKMEEQIIIIPLDCSKICNFDKIPKPIEFAFIDWNANSEDTYLGLKQLYLMGCETFFPHDTWSLLSGSSFGTFQGIQKFMKEKKNWDLNLISGMVPLSLIADFKYPHSLGSESLSLLKKKIN